MVEYEEHFIETDADLLAFLDRLHNEGVTRCSVDTEADSLHSYREKLCLIQMSCDNMLAIIDPLRIEQEALQKLVTFWDEADEVWMHGADFDMTLLQRTFDFVPARILDTQLAARLAGHTRFGLANLIADYFDIHLSKSSQKADWGARPLKDKLLRYAFDDVRYLLPLADKLTEKVKGLSRHDWFTEWCHVSRDNVLARKERSPDEIWRIPGWGKLDRSGLVFLRELWFWRDEESQSRDCPPFRVMSNQSLLDFSERSARGDNLRGAKGLNASQAKRFRAAIEKARQVPKDEWPVKRIRKGGRREEFNADEYERLRAHRDAKAAELNLEPTIIATRGILETMANYPEKQDEMLMKWQRGILFGDE
tara:strand:- start:9032 stop:10126 length:1095 start_codon:yes stop_codon:yes gene_type:complete